MMPTSLLARTIGRAYLARHATPLGAYLALERHLMRLHILAGGTTESFVQRHAETFRIHFGWMLQPAR